MILPIAVAAFGLLAADAGEPPAAPPDGLVIRMDEDARTLTVMRGARSVLGYRHGKVPFKPYVRTLATPRGANVLLDAPPDHAHHHGLMLAIGAAKVDFWSEAPPESVGTQATLAVAPVEREDGGRGLSSRLEWCGPDGDVLLVETRRITVHDTVAPPASSAPPVTLVTWHSTLSPAPGLETVELWGRHYFGLGMRLVESMDGATTFLHEGSAKGRVYRGDERLTRARWCAARGTIEGEPVTIAMLDHPGNPRAPTTWFTMASPFAYLSATPALEDDPASISAGETFEFRYGVALWDAHVDVDAIEAVHRSWLGPEGAAPSPPAEEAP